MPNSTTTAHPIRVRKPGPRVSETADARREALDWLAARLRWERTPDAVRAAAAPPDGSGS